MTDHNSQQEGGGTLYCPLGVISYNGVLVTYEIKNGQTLAREAFSTRDVAMTPELQAAIEADRARMEAKRNTGQRLSDIADTDSETDQGPGP